MDRFLEEIVVKKNKTANEILFVLSMIVMMLSATVCRHDAAMCWSTPSRCRRLIIDAARLRALRWRYSCSATVCARSMNTPSPTAIWTLPWCSTISKRKSLGSLKVRNVDAFGPVNGQVLFNRYVYHAGRDARTIGS